MRIVEHEPLSGKENLIATMRRLVDNGLKDAIVSDEVLSSHWWLIELWPGHCVMYVGTEESFHVWWVEKLAERKLLGVIGEPDDAPCVGISAEATIN